MAQLRSLRGSVRATEGGKTVFSAPLEFVSTGKSGAWVEGELRLGGATWELDRASGDALPMYGTAQLRVDSEGWKVADAALTFSASQTGFSGSGSLKEGGNRLREAKLETRYLQVGHALSALESFRGSALRLPFPLPPDAIVTGTAALDSDLSWRVDASAQTDRSDLSLKLDAKLRVIESASLSGLVAPDEGLPSSLSPFVDLAASAPLNIDATASGPIDALCAQIDLRCEGLASPWTLAAHPGVASLKIDDARRYTLELDVERAGRVSCRLGVAPYGSIDGNARLILEPGAWKLGPLRGEGTPAELDIRIGGTRKDPDLAFELKSDQLSLRRDDAAESLQTKRLRAKAALTSSKGKKRLGAAWAKARVGPGSAEVERSIERVAGKDVERTAVRLARVDADNALAALSLIMEQGWIGTGTSDARFVIPEGAQLWADLSVEGSAVTGRGHLETQHSRLSLVPLRFDKGSFEGTKALATLAFDDAVSLGLFAGSPLVPAGSDQAELEMSLSGAGPSTKLELSATARRVRWRSRGPRAVADPDLLALDSAALELSLGRGALEVRELSGTLLGGRFEAAGALRREGERSVARLERLSLLGADRVNRWLSAGGSAAAVSGLSLDLHLRGALGREDGALEGHATLTSDRSQLEASVETRGSAFAPGSGIKGFLHPGDLGSWTGPLVLDGDPMIVAAQLTGSFEAPKLEASLEGGLSRATYGGISAPVADLQAGFGLGGDGVVLHGLSLLLAGGRVDLRGLSSAKFGGAMARLSVDGVQLGAIDAVSDELQGALHLEASVWRRSGSASGVRLTTRVEEPRVEALRRVASLFSRYGLKQPSRSGRRPMTATLTLADGLLEVRDVEASLDAFTVRGGGSRSPLGIWHGDADVVVKQAFLQTSHLFVGPAAWIGDLRIPVRIQGPDGQVRADADFIAALDAVLAKTRLGRGLQKAIDALMRKTIDKKPPTGEAPRYHAPTTLAGSDALIDRIANDEPEADAALGTLLERGLEPEEIAERVIRRR